MNREKKLQLVRLMLLTLVGLIVIFVLFVQPAQESLVERAASLRLIEDKIASAQYKVNHADQFKADMEASREKLAQVEEGIVSGDAYLWIIKVMGRFNVPGHFEISNWDPPQFGETGAFHAASYRQVSFGVSGTAFYQDFLQFLWRFENTYPNIRIQRFDLDAASLATTADDAEKLAFRLQIVALARIPGMRP